MTNMDVIHWMIKNEDDDDIVGKEEEEEQYCTKIRKIALGMGRFLPDLSY